MCVAADEPVWLYTAAEAVENGDKPSASSAELYVRSFAACGFFFSDLDMMNSLLIGDQIFDQIQLWIF